MVNSEGSVPVMWFSTRFLRAHDPTQNTRGPEESWISVVVSPFFFSDEIIMDDGGFASWALMREEAPTARHANAHVDDARERAKLGGQRAAETVRFQAPARARPNPRTYERPRILSGGGVSVLLGQDDGARSGVVRTGSSIDVNERGLLSHCMRTHRAVRLVSVLNSDGIVPLRRFVFRFLRAHDRTEKMRASGD